MKHLLAVILLSLATVATAADRYFMKTEVGYIVLTDELCEYKFDEPTNFKHRAYATDVHTKEPHEGCWYLDIKQTDQGEMGSVNVYFPEINATALYNPNIFTDRKETY